MKNKWQMKSKFKVCAAAFGLLLTAIPALAHHSFTAEFDGSKTMTMHGVITKVDWINPHVYIDVDIKDANGSVMPWSFETLPTGFLHKMGVTKELLAGQPGETVTILANPTKDGTKSLGWCLKITYSDGHSYILVGGNDLPASEKSAP